jgi:tRNA pseudouridine38-40 synthase
MRNIKLLLEYDGTNYVGWQRQENGRSIQAEIETVLAKALQEEVDVIGSGRTDAGVHARGQVANFRTQSPLSPDEIYGALNGLLPEDIVVRQVEEVSVDFHARYSAKARTYSYLITLQPSALIRNFSWYVKYKLDCPLMQRAAKDIVGKHDFASFCKTQSEVEHHVCDVSLSEWSVNGTVLRYAITANRFLHGMVRALTGTMVDVGRGYTTYDEFRMILEKKDRSEAGMAAPAKGLVLESVTY